MIGFCGISSPLFSCPETLCPCGRFSKCLILGCENDFPSLLPEVGKVTLVSVTALKRYVKALML